MTDDQPNPNDPAVQDAVSELGTELAKVFEEIRDTKPTVEQLTENPRLRDIANAAADHVASIMMSGSSTLGATQRAPSIVMSGYGTLGFQGASEIKSTIHIVTEGVLTDVTATARPDKLTIGNLSQPGAAIQWLVVYLAFQQVVGQLLRDNPTSISPTVVAAVWTALAYLVQQNWSA